MRFSTKTKLLNKLEELYTRPSNELRTSFVIMNTINQVRHMSESEVNLATISDEFLKAILKLNKADK